LEWSSNWILFFFQTCLRIYIYIYEKFFILIWKEHRAQSTEHRAQSTEHRAQGTIEYLIIIAIVIVIALVVVGLMSSFLNPAAGVGQSVSKVGNWTNSLALTETSVTPDGNYLVRLANNSGEEITVSNVKIGDTNADYSQDLFQGNAQNFVIDSSDACSAGDGTTKTITITYVSRYGITKTEVYPADTFFSCEDYTVSLLANQCETCTTYTTRYLSPGSTTVTAGYYDTNSLVTVDADLTAANISSGVDIFGITGTSGTLVWGDYNSTADDWYNHIDNCSILGVVDGNDWRLPTSTELIAVIASYYGENLWSSSSVHGTTSSAYSLVSFYYGIFANNKTSASLGARCVRTA